jgi:hypothetical protein
VASPVPADAPGSSRSGASLAVCHSYCLARGLRARALAGCLEHPWDELRVRAGPELPRARTIVIDCTQEDLTICRFAGGYVSDQDFERVLLLVR